MWQAFGNGVRINFTYRVHLWSWTINEGEIANCTHSTLFHKVIIKVNG